MHFWGCRLKADLRYPEMLALLSLLVLYRQRTSHFIPCDGPTQGVVFSKVTPTLASLTVKVTVFLEIPLNSPRGVTPCTPHFF